MKLNKGKERLVLPVEILKEYLHYNPKSGVFTWIKVNPKAMSIKIGCVAGGLNSKGYIEIKFNGKIYKAHRLAWLYMTGEMPADLIDHKNGIKHENWFDNLRQATNQQNCQNKIKPQSNNTTGYLGVSLHKQHSKYQATIKINGKYKRLGLYDTAELAHAAYLTKKREHHEFCTI